jgi:ornithine cyclodeaminase/alanine dehydrogenase-like protein (mu-crystallin family)
MSTDSIRMLDAQETQKRLPYRDLIQKLEVGFRDNINAPLRHHHITGSYETYSNNLLLMPAWSKLGFGGIKIVNVNPGNGLRKLPSINSTYLLFEQETGRHLLLMDGKVLTQRRTAAASVLAAKFLARKDSRHLLIVGAGQVAKSIAQAYQVAFPLREITIFNRSVENAHRLADEIDNQNISVTVSENLSKSVAEADIISCATLAQDPLIKGKWLKPGQHLDLIGSYTSTMREADDDVIKRARIYIDTEHALQESGDLLIPLQTGVIDTVSIQGTLSELCHKKALGRTSQNEITLFKSVGSALEDLAAAELVYRSLS